MYSYQVPPQLNTAQTKILTILIWIIIGILSLPQIIIYEIGLHVPPGPLGYSWVGLIRIVL
jgi:hypothetical protein